MTKSLFAKRLVSLLREVDESGEPGTGRSYDDLRIIAGPSLGWREYVNIVKQEQEKQRRGEPLPPVDPDWRKWGYKPPRHHHTGEPLGKRDSRGRVIPWSPQEVIEGMMPLIKTLARNYATGSWDIPVFQFDDAVQLGAMGVLNALEADEGRVGKMSGTGRMAPGFASFAKLHIQKVISQGFQEGGWEYRKARGLLDDIKVALGKGATAQTARHVEDIVNGRAISRSLKRPRPNLYAPEIAGGCTGHGLGDITKDENGNCTSCGRPITNEYKKLASTEGPSGFPPLQEFVDEILAVVNSGDREALRAMQQKIEDYKEALSAEESDFLPGAKTSGSTSGIRVSHAARPVRASSIEKPAGDSETSISQHVAGEHIPSGPRRTMTPQEIAIANELPHYISSLIERGNLTTQELRILIRTFGLRQYPGKGTSSDPEISASGLSDWAKNGYPEMTANEIAQEFQIGVTRVNQLKRNAKAKLEKIAGEMMESATTATEFQVLHEVRMFLVRQILADVKSEPYPNLLLN